MSVCLYVCMSVYLYYTIYKWGAIFMNTNDNYKKAKTGYEIKKRMREMLKMMENEGQIKRLTDGYFLKDPTIKGSAHFKFDFKIDFHDNSSWIIHCTNSIRTDRFKGNRFDAEHLKRLNKNIENAFLVYPDNQSSKNLKEALRVSEQIRNKEIYSKIDDIISFRGISLLIRSKALDLSSSSSGQAYAIKGIDFEEIICSILNDSENIEKWNEPDSMAIGYSYDWFFTLLNKCGLGEEDKIKRVSATTDIPKLPSGGSPKTDVSVNVLTDKANFTYNLSCKRVTGKFVSIHQYSYEDFISALNIQEEPLKLALVAFQKHGGLNALKMHDPMALDTLESFIHLYNAELVKWAFFGIGGEGMDIQIADYLVTLNETTNSFSIHSRDQYIQKQLQVKGQFNTPFKWTYASKSKGKSIQLKGKVY